MRQKKGPPGGPHWGLARRISDEECVLLLGFEVRFSFTTFFAAQPMPAASSVRGAASMTVLTNLFSDIVAFDSIAIYTKV